MFFFSSWGRAYSNGKLLTPQAKQSGCPFPSLQVSGMSGSTQGSGFSPRIYPVDTEVEPVDRPGTALGCLAPWSYCAPSRALRPREKIAVDGAAMLTDTLQAIKHFSLSSVCIQLVP